MSDNTVALGSSSNIRLLDIRMLVPQKVPVTPTPASPGGPDHAVIPVASPVSAAFLSLSPGWCPAIDLTGGRVEMIFDSPIERYSLVLLSAFVISGTVTVLSLFALIMAPLYATEKIVILLYAILACGLGTLAFSIRRARTIHKRGG